MYKPVRSQIPNTPGVYLYKDENNKIIYVGKAKNLRNRVSTYFNGNHENSPKTQHLVKNIYNAEFIIVDNEVEALLLENKLIKKYNPKYNINLKDSKTYAYIKLTKEKFPKIMSSRIIKKDGDYFGPYTDGGARREILNLAVKIFRLRTCRTLPKRACLNYHIGLCTAPCILNVTEDEYKKQVDAAKEFLKGNTDQVLKKLKQDMVKASIDMKYEVALEKKKHVEAIMHMQEKQKVDLLKDYDQDFIAMLYNPKTGNSIIEIFNVSKGVINGKKEFKFDYDEELFESFIKMYYSQNYTPKEIVVNLEFWKDEDNKKIIENYLEKIRGNKVILTMPKKGEKLSIIKMVENNAKLNFEDNDTLLEIKEKLNLPQVPMVIECFDISNLSYDYNVAGMTRWINGKPDKAGYRKFEIKSFSGKNDDFTAMKEVTFRRYKAIKEGRAENGTFPNLIIIDGGKGQLNAALNSLKELNLQIPIISLAKKEEEIFLPGEEDSRRFPKNSKMMLLIRGIRDSVHNYVVSYNRKKREMRLREEFE